MWNRFLLPLGIVLSVTLTAYGQVSGSAAPTPGSAPVIVESQPPAFDKYPLGPDSQPQASVPKGKSFHFDITDSKIFPNAARTISVYIPAAYKADKPACTFVFLDGIGFNASTVFDNLIAQKAMPVTIAIGISSGTVSSATPPENPRFDRSFEFDSMTDRLARFILDEVIPSVQNHKTPDGLPIKLSDNPDDRAIGGSSTGGIGSFTVAWEHPEAFHRVFTSIGTFVGMRGGEDYYVLVRKTEPKPIRIFMEDGMNDEWAGAEMGDWWISNLTMNRALEFAGYDVRHSWGAGTHNGSHAASIFPDVMRWLWRDWPAPIVAKAPANRILKPVLEPGENWKVAAEGCQPLLTLAVNPKGQVLYPGSGQPAYLDADAPLAACGQPATGEEAIGPSGDIVHTQPKGGISADSGKYSGAKNLHIAYLTIRGNGDIYATTETHEGKNDLWLIPEHGEAKKLAEGLKDASGIAFSPDGLWLMVAQNSSRYGMSYRVLPNGTIDAGEPLYDFVVPAGADGSGAVQLAMDRDGRAYAATTIGVQIFDRNGRVAAIMPLPGNVAATGVCFGGHDFDTLYVAAAGKIYKRKLHIKGAAPWEPPFKLPPGSGG